MIDDAQVHLVDNVEEAGELSRWLSERSLVAVDTETTGLRHEDRVRVVQVGDGDTAWVVPVEAPGSWGGLVLSLLGRYDGNVVMHHAKFDVNKLLTSLGLEFQADKLHDTMLQARVLEPTRSAALKNLASRYVDSRAAFAQSDLDERLKGGGHTWATVPVTFEPYWFYAGLDTILTYRLHHELYPRVQAGPQPAYDLELSAALVCGGMERHGALIDQAYAREQRALLEERIEYAGRWCEEHYGVKPGSNAAVAQVLVGAGWDLNKRTPNGAIALDKEVLEGVDHPLARTVLKRRQAQKVVSAYLRHYCDDLASDGRIHPSINTCEARTGRMSMSDPNLQNLPRQSESNPLSEVVRRCVVPAPGHVLLLCDFDQIEMRIFAHLSRSPDLLGAFGEDVDFFTVMTREIFGDPAIVKKDPRRQTTKNAMYARIYGAGTAKFAWTAGITEEEAKHFSALLDLRYPAIRQLQSQIDATSRGRYETEGEAYVTSPLTGRRFTLDDDAYYKLMNYLIQGTAAEVLKMKLVELAQVGLAGYLVCPVHDEVILEVPEDQLIDVARTVQRVMNDVDLFTVPITAGLATGTSWGAKQDYEVPG